MANQKRRIANLYQDLRFPDGSHSGVRIDCRRMLLEVQRRGVKHVFDLTEIIDLTEHPCYTDDILTEGAPSSQEHR